MLLYQAIGISLVALLGYSHPIFAYSQLDRPIVTGALVGIVMGDIPMGCMIGASLELIYIGSAAIGGALPPDYCAGGVMAAAFAISTGTGIEGAVALSLPISTLVSLVKNILYTFARGWCLHKSDKYAEEGNLRGIEIMHWIAAYVAWIPLAIICGLAFYFGSALIADVLAMIPEWVTRGISAATGMLPALGLAMLAKYLNNKLVLPFFFLGFLANALFKTSILGIACIAVCVALLMVMNQGKKEDKAAVVNGGDENDF